jgi:hypothetical protein
MATPEMRENAVAAMRENAVVAVSESGGPLQGVAARHRERAA